MTDPTVCTGCSAPIRWVLTVGGKRMPLDPDPHPDGNVIRVEHDGLIRARVLTGDELPAQEPAWRAHWVTCPASADFKRRKGATTPRCVECRQPLDPVLARLGDRWHPCCAPVAPPPDVRAIARQQGGAPKPQESLL